MTTYPSASGPPRTPTQDHRLYLTLYPHQWGANCLRSGAVRSSGRHHQHHHQPDSWFEATFQKTALSGYYNLLFTKILYSQVEIGKRISPLKRLLYIGLAEKRVLKFSLDPGIISLFDAHILVDIPIPSCTTSSLS